jgi:hypothetical protein
MCYIALDYILITGRNKNGYGYGWIKKAVSIYVGQKMPKAYVLINCQIGTQEKILNQLKKVPGVVQRLAK